MKLDQETFFLRTMPIPEAGCWVWMGNLRKGYGRICGVQDRNVLAHRLSWKLFKGDPGHLMVLHKCDVPACVNPDHLFLGTRADNVYDCVAKGRAANGEKNGQCFLTPDIVRRIRAAGKEDITHREIAARFGISRVHVTNILSGVRWGWLPS